MRAVLDPLPAVAPVEYRKNGWHYRQLRRVGNFAIYSQGGGAAFEVVHIRTRPARIFKGSAFPAGEYLPATSEWGRHGWTLPALREAEAKLAVLVSLDQQNPKFPNPYLNAGHRSAEPASTK